MVPEIWALMCSLAPLVLPAFSSMTSGAGAAPNLPRTARGVPLRVPQYHVLHMSTLCFWVCLLGRNANVGTCKVWHVLCRCSPQTGCGKHICGLKCHYALLVFS